jgi:glucan biosynthesis protein C
VSGERCTDVDWLRIGAVYLLIPYHVAKVFDDAPFYHLKNDEQWSGLSYLTGGVHQWHMPLLFALAGWSLAASLDLRARSEVERERRERLLIPLVFGCAVVVPPIGYVEALHTGDWDGDFVAFLPHFYTSLEHFTWSHLWFLAYLAAFTWLYLPGLDRLRRSNWRPARIPAAALYAGVVPFALVQVTLRGRWPGYQNLYDDWANVAYFSLFLAGGFLLHRLPELDQVVQRERHRLAMLAGVGFTGMLAILATRGGLPPAGVRPDWIVFQTCSAVAGFGTVCALLGYGARHLRGRSARALPWLRDSAMPVYILHQLAIVGLATGVVTLDAPIPAKFALLLGGATAATLATYQLLVRRRPSMRALLGVKGRRPVTAARRRLAAA